MLKVSIGYKFFDGPYGGGNLFVKNLSDYLNSKGVKVVYDLKDGDIDIILIINPLKKSEFSTFNHLDAYFYKTYINKNSIIVHRINECDERKNTFNINDQIIDANNYSDYTVYVSQWIYDLFIQKGLSKKNSKVILSGSNNLYFNQKNKILWDGISKFKLVTHHWSANWMKGFDTYSLIDNLLEKPYWKDKISFTYIGNLPKNFKFKNTKVVEPLSESDLGKSLKIFHGYVTGSINEPSGNHHIEAMQSGLPVLYINSGGIPEYCRGYGVMFEKNNFENQLKIFIDSYSELCNNLTNFKNDSEKMSSEYLELFNDLLASKENINSDIKKVNKYIFIVNLIFFKISRDFYFSKIFIKKKLITLLNYIYHEKK